jgi:hypothetical protein
MNIDLICFECNSVLEIRETTTKSKDFVEIRLMPCIECINNAEEEVREELKDETN